MGIPMGTTCYMYEAAPFGAPSVTGCFEPSEAPSWKWQFQMWESGVDLDRVTRIFLFVLLSKEDFVKSTEKVSPIITNTQGDRIWTFDFLFPKQVRYQAALHPGSEQGKTRCLLSLSHGDRFTQNLLWLVSLRAVEIGKSEVWILVFLLLVHFFHCSSI